MDTASLEASAGAKAALVNDVGFAGGSVAKAAPQLQASGFLGGAISNGNGVSGADLECTEPLPEGDRLVQPDCGPTSLFCHYMARQQPPPPVLCLAGVCMCPVPLFPPFGFEREPADEPIAPLLSASGWNAQANVKAGAYETAGTRGADKMEDRHLVVPSAAGLDGEPLLLGVFDGHRGAEAAEFVAGSLEAALGAAWKEASGPGDALRRAFLAVDSEFVQEQASSS